MSDDRGGTGFFLSKPKYSSRSPKVVLVLTGITLVIAICVLVFVDHRSRWPIGLLLLSVAVGQFWTVVAGRRRR